MSEILLYKANQCSKNLNRAADNVRKEMESLDANADLVVDQVNSSFQVCCFAETCDFQKVSWKIFFYVRFFFYFRTFLGFEQMRRA